jgi:hypothetical protein
MTAEQSTQIEDSSRDQVPRHSIADGLDGPDMSAPSSTAGTVREDSDREEFNLSRRGKLIFFTLAILTLMAALDGTSLSVALPVWYPC